MNASDAWCLGLASVVVLLVVVVAKRTPSAAPAIDALNPMRAYPSWPVSSMSPRAPGFYQRTYSSMSKVTP